MERPRDYLRVMVRVRTALPLESATVDRLRQRFADELASDAVKTTQPAVSAGMYDDREWWVVDTAFKRTHLVLIDRHGGYLLVPIETEPIPPGSGCIRVDFGAAPPIKPTDDEPLVSSLIRAQMLAFLGICVEMLAAEE